MTHIAYDASVLHLIHVLSRDYTFISGGCDDDVDISNDFVQFDTSETVNRSLQGANWVDFGDINNASECF